MRDFTNDYDGHFDARLTPQEVEQAVDSLRPAWQKQLDVMQQHPIGSQYTTEGDTDVYTLVAYELGDGRTPNPHFVGETGWDHQDGPKPTVLNEIVDGWQWPHSDMTRVEPKPELADQARRIALANKQRINQFEDRVVVYDTPESLEQIEAVWRYTRANRIYLKATRATSRAAYDQALGLRIVAQACGSNQSRTARLVGIDQSRISRAIKATDGPLN